MSLHRDVQSSLTKVYIEALGLNEDHGAGQKIVFWEKPQVGIHIVPTLQTLRLSQHPKKLYNVPRVHSALSNSQTLSAP